MHVVQASLKVPCSCKLRSEKTPAGVAECIRWSNVDLH